MPTRLIPQIPRRECQLRYCKQQINGEQEWPDGIFGKLIDRRIDPVFVFPS